MKQAGQFRQFSCARSAAKTKLPCALKTHVRPNPTTNSHGLAPRHHVPAGTWPIPSPQSGGRAGIPLCPDPGQAQPISHP